MPAPATEPPAAATSTPAAAGPEPVLGDLITAAFAAIRDYERLAMQRIADVTTVEQFALDSAAAASLSMQVAVWRRLLKVAPHEFGGVQ